MYEVCFSTVLLVTETEDKKQLYKLFEFVNYKKYFLHYAAWQLLNTRPWLY